MKGGFGKSLKTIALVVLVLQCLFFFGWVGAEVFFLNFWGGLKWRG